MVGKSPQWWGLIVQKSGAFWIYFSGSGKRIYSASNKQTFSTSHDFFQSVGTWSKGQISVFGDWCFKKGFEWVLSGVYYPRDNSDKSLVWLELSLTQIFLELKLNKKHWHFSPMNLECGNDWSPYNIRFDWALKTSCRDPWWHRLQLELCHQCSLW